MGNVSTPLPVKLFIGMLAQEPLLFDRCAAELSMRYGPVERESPVWTWAHSGYYTEEMGGGLLRKFISFRQCIDPGMLAEVKHHTNGMEEIMSLTGKGRMRRTVNIDPGYVTEAKVVLASTKDYAHRISIGNGIYAEVTVVYRKEARQFTAVPHTYPDFRSDEVRAWFGRVRQDLRRTLSRGTR